LECLTHEMAKLPLDLIELTLDLSDISRRQTEVTIRTRYGAFVVSWEKFLLWKGSPRHCGSIASSWIWEGRLIVAATVLAAKARHAAHVTRALGSWLLSPIPLWVPTLTCDTSYCRGYLTSLGRSLRQRGASVCGE
jgi:hypothetical protein